MRGLCASSNVKRVTALVEESNSKPFSVDFPPLPTPRSPNKERSVNSIFRLTALRLARRVDAVRVRLLGMGYPRCTATRRSMVAGAGLRFTQIVTLVLGTLTLPAIGVAEPKCPDMIVSADDLDEILDQTLGSFRGVVDHRSVSIDPSSSLCYVRFNLTTSALSQFGGSCRLDGCSAVIYRQKSIALRDFDVTGCDPLFEIFGLSHHLPSAYVDASARIRQQCGSGDFEIDGVKVVRIAGAPKLRISFRPTTAHR